MKSISLFIFFSFFSNALFSQQLIPNKPVHDFGLIPENVGKVYCDFQIENITNQVFIVKGIISSCGCTAVGINQDTILSQKQVNLSVSYDATGRPGKFFKQISLVVKPINVADTVVLDLFVKGTVLSKGQVSFTPQDFKNAVLQIKPLVLPDKALDQSRLNDFINDITFVVDKDGFANIHIEHASNATNVITEIKRKIREGMVYRGYGAHTIGFNVKEQSNSNDTILVSVVGYTNSSIQSSTVLVKGYNYIGIAPNEVDTLISLHTFDIKDHPRKIDFSKNEAVSFINAIARQVLISKGVWVKTLINGVHSDNMDLFLKQNFTVYIEQIKRELIENGIDAAKVVFLHPVFGRETIKSIDFNVVIPEYRETISWTTFQSNLDSIREKYNINKDENFRNNVPVFYQRIINTADLDTSDVQFKEWFNLLKSKLASNPKTKILIEATSSNSPTTKKYNNDFVARRRLKSTTEILIKMLEKAGISDAAKLIVKTYAMVKGPLYHEQDFLVQQYNKFQYVKIMTIEEREKTSIDFQKLVPYSINFNTNGMEIPYGSPVFINFISTLIPYLDQFGYVELVMESSSSKVPTKDYRSNRVLAFERLQNAKEAIQKAVAERGYNPLRVVFTEERILVQGPAFNEKMDPKSEYYKDFQYIKIIPQLLIR